jgi:hypothetical protein
MSDFEERQKQAASMTTTDLIRAGNHEMIVKLTGQLAASREQVHQLREALKAVEWDIAGTCASCGTDSQDEHTADCQLAKALQDTNEQETS